MRGCPTRHPDGVLYDVLENTDLDLAQTHHQLGTAPQPASPSCLLHHHHPAWCHSSQSAVWVVHPKHLQYSPVSQ